MQIGRIRGMVLAAGLSILAVTGWAQRGPGAGTGQNNNPGTCQSIDGTCRNLSGSCQGLNGTCRTLIDSLPLQAIDATEAEALAYMREEEKLARDEYAQLYAKWGSPLFANISQSEQRHSDSIKLLLDRYGLADPAASGAVGVFSNPGLQTLYGDLAGKGAASLAAALRVGATIEDLDIRDLDEAIARTDNDDLKLVYQNLRQASRNHMRAFVSQLGALGETYSAQYISAAALAEILAGPHEAGMGYGAGARGPMGFGRGNGTCLMDSTPALTPGTGSRHPW